MHIIDAGEADVVVTGFCLGYVFTKLIQYGTGRTCSKPTNKQHWMCRGEALHLFRVVGVERPLGSVDRGLWIIWTKHAHVLPVFAQRAANEFAFHFGNLSASTKSLAQKRSTSDFDSGNVCSSP